MINALNQTSLAAFRMKIYLTLAAIPELSGLPRSERRMAYHACRGRAWGHWQTWAGTILGALLGAALGAIALYYIVEWNPFGRLLTYFLGGFVCGALIVGVTEYVRTIFVAGQIRPYLREHLEERNNGKLKPRTPQRAYHDSEY